jgi:hypothetical protein
MSVAPDSLSNRPAICHSTDLGTLRQLPLRRHTCRHCDVTGPRNVLGPTQEFDWRVTRGRAARRSALLETARALLEGRMRSARTPTGAQ